MDMSENTMLKVVILLVIILIIYVTIRYMYLIKHTHFVCPDCKKFFKPKIISIVFSMNAFYGKFIKCPLCGIKAYMEPVKDKKA